MTGVLVLMILMTQHFIFLPSWEMSFLPLLSTAGASGKTLVIIISSCDYHVTVT